jgi:hypothetical protein
MPLTTVNPAMIGQTSTGAASLTATGSAAASLVTAAGTALSADSSGRVTMPFQPAFYATRTAGNVASNTIVIFNNVLTNIGGHYNSSNGRFTAPIAGTYRICARLLLGSTGFAIASIRRNGTVVGIGQWNSSVSNGATGMAEVILILAAGDYIETLNPAGDVYGADTFTAFSGQLIG